MAEPPPSRKAPGQLGRYEIVREIGRGAMGVVYLARDPLIGRHVALKTFRLAYAADEDEMGRLQSRFIREARSAGILSQHPGIVTIHDVAEGAEGAPPFIAMEYVEGTDLKELMRRQGSPDPAVVAETVSGIADALDYAHAKGVVHRDIKPANVILAADRKIRITDFGIARLDLDASNLTLDGQLLGTPNYMAPEQVVGGDVDHRADIFSLGVIAYELLTGSKPFTGENLTAVTHRIVHEAHPPPSSLVPTLSEAVDAAIDRALAKAASRRWPRAGDFAAALSAAIPRGGADTAPSFELPPSVAADRSPPAPGPKAESAAPASPAVESPDAVAPLPPQPPTEEFLTPGSGAAASAAPHLAPGSAASVADAESGPGVDEAEPALWRRLASHLGRELRAVGRRRLVVIAAATLIVGLVGAGVLAMIPQRIAPREATIVDSAPAARLIGLLRQGRRQLAAGEPAAAAASFRRAERLAPGRSRVRALRQRAEAEAAAIGQELEDEIESGLPEDFGSPLVPEAILGPDEVPIVVAGSGFGAEPIDETSPSAAPEPGTRRPAAGGQRPDLRRSDLLRPGRDRSGSAPGTRSGSGAAPSGTVSSTARATLRVELVSARSSGSVVVAVNEKRIISRNFEFFEKGGRFSRRRPTGGELSLGPAEVPAGVVDLDVWVAVEGRPARLTEMTASFPPGRTRQLRVDIDAEGDVEVRLE